MSPTSGSNESGVQCLRSREPWTDHAEERPQTESIQGDGAETDHESNVALAKQLADSTHGQQCHGRQCREQVAPLRLQILTIEKDDADDHKNSLGQEQPHRGSPCHERTGTGRWLVSVALTTAH